MRVQYENRFGDMVAFALHHYVRSPVVFLVCLVATLSMAYPELKRLHHGEVKPGWAAFYIVVAAVILGVFFVVTTVLSLISGRNKTVLTRHALSLEPESFSDETVYSKSENKWSVVQKLTRTKEHVFIYISQHIAYVIPRRAFKDNSEWDAFYEYCRKRTETA